MRIKYFRPIYLVLLYASTTYVLCKILFYALHFEKKEALFKHSINTLFIVFTLASLLIIAVVLIVKMKYFDSVGYAFMALTSLKIGILLFWARPILKSATIVAKFEKGNFFILFAVFLAIETIVAIRILNNKQ